MTEKSPHDLELTRQFLAQLADRLNLDPALIGQTMPHLLGMTKHVAHGVVRPAEPLAALNRQPRRVGYSGPHHFS
ncbi:MAG: DUF6457 domain-containing protein [Rothia sp. (in: high G+C Gram-positive bacteria)]|nr:DUF6457 domain-containing protein [Rothia sp. (in: high G+C Gram-positive bacteria)]